VAPTCDLLIRARALATPSPPAPVAALNGAIEKPGEFLLVKVGRGDDAKARGLKLKGRDGGSHSRRKWNLSVAVDRLQKVQR
jgi:hypothetical protein